jgi:alkylation response protein AidB-like acyl-CoA dehydrogenase
VRARVWAQDRRTKSKLFRQSGTVAKDPPARAAPMLTRSTRVLHRAARRLPRRNLSTLVDSSESVQEQFDPANPTAEHRALRKMVQEFTKNEVEPQALQYNREERLNRALFERAGELGLLGVTADPEYGGAGMDATAACIVHEVPPFAHDAGTRRLSPGARAVQELSYSDPAFCLSYLAHSQLFVNNLARNGSVAQVACFWVVGRGLEGGGG